MLNKKSLFNFVYAIALVGAVISCFDILNELLNVVQLYNVEINNTITVYIEAGYRIHYFKYLFSYTFRSGVMSFVANMGILLMCHFLDAKCKNSAEGE